MPRPTKPPQPYLKDIAREARILANAMHDLSSTIEALHRGNWDDDDPPGDPATEAAQLVLDLSSLLHKLEDARDKGRD